VQGYFLSRPLPASDLIPWLRSRNVGTTREGVATGSSRTVLE
jgi:EAL domain-containing protein (putative c-di-GMP-specific phosphodiesterase class I)